MPINPYLATRQKVLGLKQEGSSSRNLYDKSTLLREATFAKAGQLETLKKAAQLGDPNAREQYGQAQQEFNQQMQQIAELDQLKTHRFQKQLEQLRLSFLNYA